METDEFLNRCNSAMGFTDKQQSQNNQQAINDEDIDLMNLFGNTGIVEEFSMDEEPAPAREENIEQDAPHISIQSIEINPEPDLEFNIDHYVAASKQFTELEADFIQYAVRLLNTGQNERLYSGINDIATAYHSAVYPEKEFPGTSHVLFDYLCSRYGVNISYETFKTINKKALFLLRTLAHPYREMSLDEVPVLEKFYLEDSFFVKDIYDFSLEPRDTKLICSLQLDGQFCQSEASYYCDDYDKLYFYLMLADKGLYNREEYQNCIQKGTYKAYATGLLNGDNIIADILTKRADSNQCMKYLGAVSPDVVSKYRNAFHLPQLLRYASMYQINKELVQKYFIIENPFALELEKRLEDRNFMVTIQKDPSVFPLKLLEAMCTAEQLLLEENEIPCDLAEDIMANYLQGNIGKSDVFLYLVAWISGGRLTKSVKTVGTKNTFSNFIKGEIISIISNNTLSIPDGIEPKMYQLRFGNSSLVFSMYEFLNFYDYYYERIRKYSDASRVVSYNQVKDIGICINFGRGMNKYRRVQENEKRYHCSVQAWIEDLSKHRKPLHLKDIQRYNVDLVASVVPREYIDSYGKILDALRATGNAKYVFYDTVLNYLFYNNRYCVIMSKLNFTKIVYALRTAIFMDSEFNISFMFLHSLFSLLYPQKSETDFAVNTITKGEPKIIIRQMNHTLITLNTRLELFESFDEIIKYFSSAKFQKIKLCEQEGNLIVQIC